MRVDGVPYGTLSSTEWTLEELVKFRAVIQLPKGDHLLSLLLWHTWNCGYAPYLSSAWSSMSAGPRALAANHGESAGIACHRLTGFACINIASSLAGDHNVARVNSIMGPVVCIHPYVLYNC
jgi:hypothetical protein